MHDLSSDAQGDRRRLLPAERWRRNLQGVAMFVFATAAIVGILSLDEVALSIYGVLAIGYLTIKLVMSLGYEPRTDPAPECSVAVVVPFYNEDPTAFEACLRSILAQTRPPEEIYVVDDGSDSPAEFALAGEVLAGAPVSLHRFEHNRGKRHAQTWAFTRTSADIVVTIDSDTVLDPEAIAEGLRAFADPEVQAVTGNVMVLNRRKNLLTRLTAVRYANAFLWERAAYGAVGAVLCACGSFSLWRRDLLIDNLEDYVSQTFMGVEVMYGDDRRLTNYALRRGKVLLQDTAIAYTVVPERFGHYLRQQSRWNRSFFRETMWALRKFRPWNRVWWLSFGELSLWFVFTFLLVAVLVVYPLITGHLPSAWYLVFLALMAYARSVRYVGSRIGSVAHQLGGFSMAPLYGLMHITVLMPIRVWSLATLGRRAWGTRGQVEVRVEEAAVDESRRPGSRDPDGRPAAWPSGVHSAP